MGSKYYDASSVIQVIGCSLKKPSLLDSDGQYFYNEDDFVSDFHTFSTKTSSRVVFLSSEFTVDFDKNAIASSFDLKK